MPQCRTLAVHPKTSYVPEALSLAHDYMVADKSVDGLLNT